MIIGLKLNDNKAGMEGIDKENINRIILEASKGSKFYEKEQKKEEEVKSRISKQKKQLNKITPTQFQASLKEADRLIDQLESSRDLSRTIVHVDMDAFYAAVEMKDNPELLDKPMAVGGNSMLSTSNYIARKYGVRAAMPGFIAKKLCPDLVIVPPNFDKYTAVSKEIRAVFSQYDPNFCPMSLDEAYLDFTAHIITRFKLPEEKRTFYKKKDPEFHCMCSEEQNVSSHGTTCVENYDWLVSGLDESFSQSQSVSQESMTNTCPRCGKTLPTDLKVVFGKDVEDAVNEMRFLIQQKTKLTASAGIAPNMMLTKVCSDKNKPNGQYRIQPNREDVMLFVKDLPIRKVCGIGKVTEKMLNALGVVTCSDLYQKRAVLCLLYSTISYHYFMRICLGLGSTCVERDGERKSMSVERTFEEINKPDELFSKSNELSQALADDLKDEELKGRTVTIKLKTIKFEVRTRAVSLSSHTRLYDDIATAAKRLIQIEIDACSPYPLRLRLMGVRMSNLLSDGQCVNKQQTTITSLFQKLKPSTLTDCNNNEELVIPNTVRRDERVRDIPGDAPEVITVEGEDMSVRSVDICVASDQVTSASKDTLKSWNIPMSSENIAETREVIDVTSEDVASEDVLRSVEDTQKEDIQELRIEAIAVPGENISVTGQDIPSTSVDNPVTGEDILVTSVDIPVTSAGISVTDEDMASEDVLGSVEDTWQVDIPVTCQDVQELRREDITVTSEDICATDEIIHDLRIKDIAVPGEGISVTGQDIHVTSVDISVTGQDIPLTSVNFPVTGEDIPVMSVDIPVTSADISVTDKDISVTDKDIPVTGQDIPVTGQDIPVTGQDIPVTGQDIPVTGQDIPVTGQDIRVTSKDISVANQDIHVTDKDIQGLRKGDIAVTDKDNQELKKEDIPVTSKDSIEFRKEEIAVAKEDNQETGEEDTTVINQDILETREEDISLIDEEIPAIDVPSQLDDTISDLEDQGMQSDVYKCPVCGNTSIYRTLFEFNRHLDKCLSGKSPTPSQNKTQTKKKTVTVKRSKVIKKENNDKLNRSGTLDSWFPSQEPRSQQLTCTVDTNSSSCPGDLYVCPVCQVSQLQINLEGFNRHVDQCLNSSKIEELLNEQRSQKNGMKRKAASRSNSNASSKKKKSSSQSSTSRSRTTLDNFLCQSQEFR